jgi:hypothetical protein
MTAAAMIVRSTPRSSSPAQERAAQRLGGIDGAARPHRWLPCPSRSFIILTRHSITNIGAIAGFRAGRDTSLPKRGPNAGTMGLVRPRSGSMISITRTVDWPTDPLHTPSGGGLRADPVQKQDPGEGNAQN